MAKHKNNILRMPTKSYRKADVDDVVSIGFFISRDFSPISWLVRKITGKPFSNLYFKFRDKKIKEGKIFYTDGINLTYSSEKIFDKNNKTISESIVQVNKSLYDEFLNECHKNAGTKHSIFRHLFKPKDQFKPEEWIFYLIEDRNPNWIDTDPTKLKDKQIFEYLTKRDIKNANKK